MLGCVKVAFFLVPSLVLLACSGERFGDGGDEANDAAVGANESDDSDPQISADDDGATSPRDDDSSPGASTTDDSDIQRDDSLAQTDAVDDSSTPGAASDDEVTDDSGDDSAAEDASDDGATDDRAMDDDDTRDGSAAPDSGPADDRSDDDVDDSAATDDGTSDDGTSADDEADDAEDVSDEADDEADDRVTDDEDTVDDAATEEDADDAPTDSSDLSSLSDEFEDASSLGDWQRVNDVEAWNADQLEVFDIDQTFEGQAFMRPYTSAWYEDRRGPLAFKEVSGDFIVSSFVTATEQDGDGPPSSIYSLAGLMIRQPQERTPETWLSGRENYVFFSIGSGDTANTFEVEVKQTVNGTSTPEVAEGRGAQAELRIARVGAAVICLLRWPNDEWRVHRRYDHPFLPSTLQVGMTAYTNWDGLSQIPSVEYNLLTITEGNADLDARFEYVRFERPELSADVNAEVLLDANDEDLIELLTATD